MIRNATMADLPQLSELFRQLHRHHVNIAPDSFCMPFGQYFELEMKSFLDDEALTVLLSEQDGTALAYAVYRITKRENAGKLPAKILFIEQFTVAENARRSGEGAALFGALKQHAEKLCCALLQLGAAAQNECALEFYKAMGMLPRTIKLELKLN